MKFTTNNKDTPNKKIGPKGYLEASTNRRNPNQISNPGNQSQSIKYNPRDINPASQSINSISRAPKFSYMDGEFTDWNQERELEELEEYHYCSLIIKNKVSQNHRSTNLKFNQKLRPSCRTIRMYREPGRGDNILLSGHGLLEFNSTRGDHKILEEPNQNKRIFNNGNNLTNDHAFNHQYDNKSKVNQFGFYTLLLPQKDKKISEGYSSYTYLRDSNGQNILQISNNEYQDLNDNENKEIAQGKAFNDELSPILEEINKYEMKDQSCISCLENIRVSLIAICIHQAEKRSTKLKVGCDNSFSEKEYLNNGETLAKPTKKNQKSEEGQFVDSTNKPPLAPKYRFEEVLALCLRDKPSSMEVQNYLDNLGEDDIGQVSKELMIHLDFLLTNRFGSYVVQHLVEIYPPAVQTVGDLVKTDVIRYSLNEFSSRVMQTIFRLDRGFSIFCFEIIKSILHIMIEDFTGSILLTKLVSSLSSDSIYSHFLTVLENDINLLKNPYFTRILSSMVSRCSDKIFDRVVDDISNHIWILMNEKFGNCILQVIHQRKHVHGKELVKQTCIKNVATIMIRRYPKIMITNLINENIAGDLPETILNHMIINRLPAIHTIVQRRESSTLFFLMLLSVKSSKYMVRLSRMLMEYLDDQTIALMDREMHGLFLMLLKL